MSEFYENHKTFCCFALVALLILDCWRLLGCLLLVALVTGDFWTDDPPSVGPSTPAGTSCCRVCTLQAKNPSGDASLEGLSAPYLAKFVGQMAPTKIPSSEQTRIFNGSRINPGV